MTRAASPKKASIETRFTAATENLARARKEIQGVIYGQDTVIDLTLTSIVAGGHALLIGLPGMAKTLLVDTVSTVLGLDSNRIQCTPDLMPADVTGSEVLEEDAKGKRNFRFIKGPVFTQFLMADEINRASPRTQSALLQAMQEHKVTAGGATHALPEPFHLLATQNPLEHEGTYPLPEAQLDRFLMQIDVGYPDRDSERAMLLATTGNNKNKIKAVMKPADLLDIQSLARDIPVGEKVVDAILGLVRSARPEEGGADVALKYIGWPPGPRAGQALLMAVRAKALIEGRETPSFDDVRAMALPVLRHRMALNFNARNDGVGIEDVISNLTQDL